MKAEASARGGERGVHVDRDGRRAHQLLGRDRTGLGDAGQAAPSSDAVRVAGPELLLGQWTGFGDHPDRRAVALQHRHGADLPLLMHSTMSLNRDLPPTAGVPRVITSPTLVRAAVRTRLLCLSWAGRDVRAVQARLPLPYGA